MFSDPVTVWLLFGDRGSSGRVSVCVAGLPWDSVRLWILIYSRALERCELWLSSGRWLREGSGRGGRKEESEAASGRSAAGMGGRVSSAGTAHGRGRWVWTRKVVPRENVLLLQANAWPVRSAGMWPGKNILTQQPRERETGTLLRVLLGGLLPRAGGDQGSGRVGGHAGAWGGQPVLWVAPKPP